MQQNKIESLEDFQNRYLHNVNRIYATGGQAEILIGYDRQTDRKVAIKRGFVKFANREKYSIKKEFELGSTLNHKNLLNYFDVYRINTKQGEVDFGIMEFIPNYLPNDYNKQFPSGKTPAPTITRYIADVMPDEKELNQVLMEVLDGLEFLHQRGIVHRDLKPANILIDYDINQRKATPKIIDFGISKELSETDTVSTFGGGTKPYMSPEQFDIETYGPIRPTCDIWALGVILYQIFTAELPFGQSSKRDYSKGRIIQEVLSGNVPDKVNTLRDPYRSIIKHALVLNPNQRIQNVQQVKDLLRGKDIKEILNQNTQFHNKTDIHHNNPNVSKTRIHNNPTDNNRYNLEATSFDNQNTDYQNDQNNIQKTNIDNRYQGDNTSYDYRNQQHNHNANTQRHSDYYDKKQEQAPKKKGNRRLWIAAIILLLGIGGYFGYEEYKKKMINDFINEAIDLFKKGELDFLNYADSYKKLSKYKDSKYLSPEAHYHLGEIYRQNLGGLFDDINEEEALKWYQKAADKDETRAQIQVGDFHLEGRANLEEDGDEALKWYEKAVNNGDFDGAFSAGKVYYEGLGGVSKDHYDALYWFKKGAKNDNPDCNYYCGRMYEYGEGMDENDLEEALNYYEKAKSLGYKEKEVENAIARVKNKINY